MQAYDPMGLRDSVRASLKRLRCIALGGEKQLAEGKNAPGRAAQLPEKSPTRVFNPGGPRFSEVPYQQGFVAFYPGLFARQGAPGPVHTPETVLPLHDDPCPGNETSARVVFMTRRDTGDVFITKEGRQIFHSMSLLLSNFVVAVLELGNSITSQCKHSPQYSGIYHREATLDFL